MQSRSREESCGHTGPRVTAGVTSELSGRRSPTTEEREIEAADRESDRKGRERWEEKAGGTAPDPDRFLVFSICYCRVFYCPIIELEPLLDVIVPKHLQRVCLTMERSSGYHDGPQSRLHDPSPSHQLL